MTADPSPEKGFAAARKRQTRRALRRLLVGAFLGFGAAAVLAAGLFWRSGRFDRDPFCSPPAELYLFFAGLLGAVVGALASQFSRSWRR